MPSGLRGFRLAVLASFFTSCFAQEALLEKFFQQEQESGDGAENILQELLAAPLDLNLAAPAELLRLPFLSREQIAAFLAHRKTAVYYSNLEEALAALRVSGDTLALCRHVFKTSAPPGVKAEQPWQANVRWRIGRPPEIDPRWPGPAYRHYQRLQVQWGEIQTGALFERDAGESRWDDHRAFYLQWQGQRAEQGWRMIAGSYQIEWGHGLAFWSPYLTSISSDVHAPARHRGRGVRPFLSSSENSSLYGGAVLRHWRALQILSFASAQKYDAHFRGTTHAVRYNDSGYHRSTREISEQKNLQERAWGGGLQIGTAGHALGLLVYTAHYSHPWQADDAAVDHFAFTGKHNAVASLTGHWRERDLYGSFEIAASRSGGKAGSVIVAGEQRHWAWTMAWHYAEVDFHSPHGLNPSEGTNTPAGATGYEAGLTCQPVPAVTGEFYYQRAQNLWQTSTLPFPPQHRRCGGTITWKAHRQLHFLLRYHRSGNEYLAHRNSGVLAAPQLPQQIETIRFELAQWFADRLRLRPRLDFARELRQQTVILTLATAPGYQPTLRRQNTAGPWGAALSLDFAWRISARIHFSFGQAVFDTAVPVYYYENDLPGIFTVQALRERGARRYIYLHLKAFGHARLGLKFAETNREVSTFLAQTQRAWGVQIDWAR